MRTFRCSPGARLRPRLAECEQSTHRIRYIFRRRLTELKTGAAVAIPSTDSTHCRHSSATDAALPQPNTSYFAHVEGARMSTSPHPAF